MNFDTGIGQILVDLENFSKRHYGRKCRLPVAAFVASLDSPVWARQVARAVEIGENQAAAELREMVEEGALQIVPTSYDRRVVYQRVSDPFWDFVRAKVDRMVRARDPAGSVYFWAMLAERGDPEQLPESAS
jgi:hypothetical protein